MKKIKPSIGKRVRFNIWHDTEYLGKIYTDTGDGMTRPSRLEEWTGVVVSIEKRNSRQHISGRDRYTIKRDFDGTEWFFYSTDIVDYVE